MKRIYLYIAIMITAISIFSCNSNNPDITSSLGNKEINKSEMLPPSTLILFGIYWRTEDLSYSLSSFGPLGIGWQAITLNVLNHIDINNAVNDKFNLKVGIIDRDILVGGNQDSIKFRIDAAKNKNVNWILIENALTGNYSENKIIKQSTMDYVGNLAHSYHLSVAVSEDCYIVYYNTNYMAQNWLFYKNNVDIIMPYGYDRTVSNLENFYSWIRSQFKLIVPILGYNVKINGSIYNQLGNRGDVGLWEAGFIELASKYAYGRYIFYYYEPVEDLTSLQSLSEYLTQNGYLISANY